MAFFLFLQKISTIYVFKYIIRIKTKQLLNSVRNMKIMRKQSNVPKI